MLVVFTSTITQRTWIGICVTVGHTIWECVGRPLPTHKGMCRQTPTQGIGLVRTSPQGQLQGIVENCASILAQWKGFLWQTQVGVRRQLWDYNVHATYYHESHTQDQLAKARDSFFSQRTPILVLSL